MKFSKLQAGAESMSLMLVRQLNCSRMVFLRSLTLRQAAWMVMEALFRVTRLDSKISLHVVWIFMAALVRAMCMARSFCNRARARKVLAAAFTTAAPDAEEESRRLSANSWPRSTAACQFVISAVLSLRATSRRSNARSFAPGLRALSAAARACSKLALAWPALGGASASASKRSTALRMGVKRSTVLWVSASFVQGALSWCCNHLRIASFS
mmetsp:Transcript_66628/g.142506  ORF Transcript_66628/g.142506 Transcript_66628/m.142506 type:complete len:212 (-) Transcript_66628:4-639(-)